MKNGNATRTETLMSAVRAKIASRALSPGDRLPSVRSFAESMAVSPSTVVEAYGRLEAEGVIRARRGSGFYVTGADLPPMALGEAGPAIEREVDPFWVARQSLDADRSVLMPGCGWLPDAWMPHGSLRKGLRALSRAGDALLCEYPDTRGSLALRRLLLGRFAEEGISADPDQVMLTTSSTSAIDLICRLLLRPGDTVLLDDPCYFNFQALLRAHQVRIIGVPFTPQGPDLEAFEKCLVEEKPRLYITNSALHNPTGASISPQVAHRVLSLASTHGISIVEDDIFSEFETTPSPRYAVLDGLDRVIRVGSFSKTLSASVRCGYVAARKDWIESLIDIQIATSFGGPSPLTTALITNVLTSSVYRKHMQSTRNRLATARRQVADQLAEIGIVPEITPRGGFYLWCRLPEGVDSTRLAKRCLEKKVILAPGNVFSVSQTVQNFLRFNVAHMNDKRIMDTLRDTMRQIGR